MFYVAILSEDNWFFFLNPSGRSNPFPHPAGEKHVAEDKNWPLPPCALSTYVFKQIFDFFPNVSPKTGFSYSYGWRCLIVPPILALTQPGTGTPIMKAVGSIRTSGVFRAKNLWPIFRAFGAYRYRTDQPTTPTQWVTFFKNWSQKFLAPGKLWSIKERHDISK